MLYGVNTLVFVLLYEHDVHLNYELWIMYAVRSYTVPGEYGRHNHVVVLAPSIVLQNGSVLFTWIARK